MSIDSRLVAHAHTASQRIAAAQRTVDEARVDFQRAVRALYLDGGSLREIADALGLSHQRVHQILDLPSGRTASARRRRGHQGAHPCSFCGRSPAQVPKLIAGEGGVALCAGCVGLAGSSIASGEPAWSAEATVAVQPAPAQCPFCGKHTGVELVSDPRTPLRLVIAPGTTPPAAICEECLELCAEIIAETRS